LRSEDITQFCVSINGPGDQRIRGFTMMRYINRLFTYLLDLLTLKLVCESHQRWGTFLPNLGTLGLWVLELFAMYVTDGQTDGLTDGRTDKSNAYCPLPYGEGA